MYIQEKWIHTSPWCIPYVYTQENISPAYTLDVHPGEMNTHIYPVYTLDVHWGEMNAHISPVYT